MTTYTYSGDPSTSPADQVRFLVRDTGPVPANASNTDPTGWELSDQEIAWLLTEDSNVYMAASLGATQIATAYGIKADKRIGPLMINYRGQLQTYTNLAEALRRKANTYASNVTVLTTQSDQCHLFEIGMNDNPQANSSLGAFQSPWYGSQS